MVVSWLVVKAWTGVGVGAKVLEGVGPAVGNGVLGQIVHFVKLEVAVTEIVDVGTGVEAGVTDVARIIIAGAAVAEGAAMTTGTGVGTGVEVDLETVAAMASE